MDTRQFAKRAVIWIKTLSSPSRTKLIRVMQSLSVPEQDTLLLYLDSLQQYQRERFLRNNGDDKVKIVYDSQNNLRK